MVPQAPLKTGHSFTPRPPSCPALTLFGRAGKLSDGVNLASLQMPDGAPLTGPGLRMLPKDLGGLMPDHPHGPGQAPGQGQPLQDGHRDGLLQNGPFKEGPHKDGPVRDGAHKDGLHRDGHKDGLHRNGYLQNGGQQDGWHRNGQAPGAVLWPVWGQLGGVCADSAACR